MLTFIDYRVGGADRASRITTPAKTDQQRAADRERIERGLTELRRQVEWLYARPA